MYNVVRRSPQHRDRIASQRSKLRGAENIWHSKLHLVDLAGSERLKKTMEREGKQVVDNTTKRESM